MLSLSASLVASLFGGSTSGTSSGDAASAIVALKRAQVKGAEAKGVAAERKDPVTITALKQFEAAVAKARDVKSALQDPRVLAVLLPALGLADQAAYPGLVQRALLADPKDPKGLLTSLDGRFKAAATTLDLKAKGLAGLRDPALLANLENGYVQYQYQQGLDDKNAGMADALYFIQNAAAKTDVYGILGNAVMRRVVTGALGLPAQMAVQSVETQARAITAAHEAGRPAGPEEGAGPGAALRHGPGRDHAAAAPAACSPCSADVTPALHRRPRCPTSPPGPRPPTGAHSLLEGSRIMAIATKPDLRPSNPRFSSGPCAKRPGWTLDALSGAFLGRSHRAKDPKARLAEVIDRSKAILGLPEGWRLGIVPASDTGAVEMALWSMLGARGVDVLAWESFSKDWATDVLKQLKLKDARVIDAPYGRLPDLDRHRRLARPGHGLERHDLRRPPAECRLHPG